MISRRAALPALFAAASVATLSKVAWAQGAPPAVFDVRCYGATGNGFDDDGPAFQSALDAARPTGGVVFVPPGRYRIATQVEADYLHGGSTLTLQGCGSASIIFIDRPSSVGFSLGNVDGRVTLSDLVFTGAPTGKNDCLAALVFGGCGLVEIDRCAFYDLAGATPDFGSVIYLYGCPTVMRSCQFVGCYGEAGVIFAQLMAGLHLEDCHFFDLGELNGVGNGKTAGSDCWIRVPSVSAWPIPSAAHNNVLSLERCKLDEGPLVGVRVDPSNGRLGRMRIRDTMSNKQHGGTGYHLSRVDSLTVDGAWLGWGTAGVTAFVLFDCGNVRMRDVTSPEGALVADAACRSVRVDDSAFHSVVSAAAETLIDGATM